MRPDSVDIVLPVYHGNINVLEKNLLRLNNELEKLNNLNNYSIVISINGPSQDQIILLTDKLAREHSHVRILKTTLRGKGWGVFNAWIQSEADIVCYMDVDLSTDLQALPALLSCLKEGADFAVGSRYIKGSRIHRTLKRYLLSKVYHVLLINKFLGIHLTDVQCGFKACRREVAQKIIPQVKDRKWFFEAELLYYAYRSGYTIREIPVNWRESPPSSLHILRASLVF